jgi:hypothetical protein
MVDGFPRSPDRDSLSTVGSLGYRESIYAIIIFCVGRLPW